MNIAAINMSPNLDSLMTDIARYDVTQHALELQMYGFTVVPPEKLGVDEAWTARLRDAVIRTYQKRYDVEIGDYKTTELDRVLGLHSPFPFRESIDRSEHLRSFALTGTDPFA